MDVNVIQLNERLMLAQRQMMETTRSNLDECNKFFLAAWEIENDPFCPLKVSEIFAGINVPDVRNPEQSLEKLFPHFFVRVLDPNSPDYNSHHPGSAEYMREQEELLGIIRSMRAVQQSYNEKEYEECLRKLGDRT